MLVGLALNHIFKNWKQYLVLLLILCNVAFASTAYLFYESYSSAKSELSELKVIDNARISEIQNFNKELGRANSRLVTQAELASKNKIEIDNFKKEIKSQTDKINEKDLKIRSSEKTIASLKGTTYGGKSTVTIVSGGGDDRSSFETVVDVSEVCGEKLAYHWSDVHNRFELFDPDIGNSNDEKFSYKQMIRIKGIVLTDSTGKVQVKKVTAEEVVEIEGGSDGRTFMKIDGGEVTLVDSEFEYSIEPEKKEPFNLLGPITLRPVVGFDLPYMTPSIGLEVLNIGRWIPYVNLGLVPKFSFDISSISNGSFESLRKSRIGLGLVYQFIPPMVDTNIGLGISLGAPLDDISSLMLSVDLIFYLTQDLFPF